MKNAIRILLLIFILFFGFIIIMYFKLDSIKIRQTKDYNSIIVDNGELADYRVFVYCNGKYEALKQLGIERRAEVANYMYDNHLKLKEGLHDFIRINPTFEELIDDNFKFEPINGNEIYMQSLFYDNIVININTSSLNSNYIEKNIFGNKIDTTKLSELNEVVLYNIYKYLKDNNYRIDSGNYNINYCWWFYNGYFIYDGENHKVFNYLKDK